MIHVKQGSVRPHVSENDSLVVAIRLEDGWTIRMSIKWQIARTYTSLTSVFSSNIQSLLEKPVGDSINTVLEAVQTACANVRSEKLEQNFVPLQAILNCILQNEALNAFKSPRLHKQKMKINRNL